MRGTTWLAAGSVSVLAAISTGGTPRAWAQTSRSSVPLFEPDPLWSQALPNQWVTGQVGGVAVDSHDNVWIFQRPATIPDGEKAASLHPPQAECCIPAPPVLEFDTNGKFLRAWGGPGQGFEWFASEHGIFVDSKDNVWLSGNAKQDNQILKFTASGKFLMQIGHAGKNQGSNDTANLGGPAGLFVYPKTNELFVADGYFNHRVIVFDADTGAYKRHWGAYGRKPDDNLKFPPRAQLVQGPPPQGFNNPVHAVLVTNDDLVYVADRSNNRLQVFKLDGTFVKEAFIARSTLQSEGTVHGFAVSPDRAQRFLYVADGSNKTIHVLNRQTLEAGTVPGRPSKQEGTGLGPAARGSVVPAGSLEEVSRVGGHAGHNAREFFHIHGIAADSKGNLFLGEVNNGQRYYKYAFKGMSK